MLAVQTAEELLIVPEGEIASISPAYPDRSRVVLADGRVGHRPGVVSEGPWARVGDCWLHPHWVVREGEFWRDPAGYLFAYEPLAEWEEAEFLEDGLPEGLLCVEKRGREWVWRTDTGELPCELREAQLGELSPQLCAVARGLLVNLQRIRRVGARSRGGWVELDTGERILVSGALVAELAMELGCESLATIDLSVRGKLWKLRELPYDLRTVDPERILRDLPTARIFADHLLWQVAMQHERGEVHDYGSDAPSFASNPLASAGLRCGYPLGESDLARALKDCVSKHGVVTLRQLGFRELDPSKRRVGWRLPRVVLLAPLAQASAAGQAAEELGVSMLLVHHNAQLPLEYLAAELEDPIQLVAWGLTPVEAHRMRDRFARLGLATFGRVVLLRELSELAATAESLPKPWATSAPEPFRRVPLQDNQGIVFVEPDQIACWSPSLPARWRVVLADGRVLHHPGPVPAGPWVALAEHWVQARHLLQEGDHWVDPACFRLPFQALPAAEWSGKQPVVGGPALPCSVEQVLWLEERDGEGIWHLEGGRQFPSGLGFEEASCHHPGLSSLSRNCRVNHNRIESTQFGQARPKLRLDDGSEFSVPRGSFAQRLQEAMGLQSFYELSPDPQRLRALQLRDYPYEIARADAARLRADFASAEQLIGNVLWQVFTRKFVYGDTFSGFFYRPLQALLYRAGFLSRAQLRAPWRALSAKDQLYLRFSRLLTRMVQECRLFNYREFGFKDPFPEDRILGSRQPQRILLAEKGDRVEEIARRLAQEFGISLLVLKGMPSLLASEYFEEALRQIYQGEVEVYFYGDFDEAGWDMGPTFRKQMRFYGRKCNRVERVVMASCFTLEEQNLYSRGIPTKTPTAVSRVARFVRESGGVQGQARGIHANWLQPFERVQARLKELLG